MKIQTMSVVVGGPVCNAKCPFCISKITPKQGNSLVEGQVNWRNFRLACELANKSGVTTVLLTGKGEPTLYPFLISNYLRALQLYGIPFKELQTNGIMIENDADQLKEWYALGLTTVCLSMVSIVSKLNAQIYQPNFGTGYMDIDNVIKTSTDQGLMVRMSCMMLKGYTDSVDKVKSLVGFCRDMGVKQLTIRPIDAPEKADNKQSQWVKENTIDPTVVSDIKQFLKEEATPVLDLAHGGVVYDLDGQNVCWATCITTNKSTDDMRQIIFFPDGTISYDWKYKGAVLLG